MSEEGRKSMAVKRRRKAFLSRPAVVALAMLAPALTVLGTFVFFPVVYVFFLSFMEWDLISPNKQFVGMENYLNLARSGEFRAVLLRTVIYSGATALITLPLPCCSPCSSTRSSGAVTFIVRFSPRPSPCRW